LLPRPPYPFGRGSRGLPPPSVFTYKYRGGQQEKKKKPEEQKRGDALKIERKKKKKTRRGRKKGRTKEEKTERTKTRKETVHRHRQQRRLEPPPPASTTVSQQQQPPQVSPSPLRFLLLLRLATPAPTVHLACEQWRALFTLAALSPAHVVGAGRPSPCIWARSGPFKKN